MSAPTYRVTAPNREYNGKTGACQFSDGVYEGAVEDGTLAYFQQAGYAVETVGGDTDEVDASELKGAALDQALEDAGLPTTGKADEKRARLAEFQASKSAGDDDTNGA